MSFFDSEFHRNKARALLSDAELIFDETAVQQAVDKVAQQLNERFNVDDGEAFPLVLGVMGGAVVFCGQLLTRLRFPLEFDYMHVTRYGSLDQGGKIEWKVIPRSSVQGRTVVVLDDILDEGETLAHVKERLLEMGAADVVVAVFADKDIGKKKPIKADYIGLTLPNKFVVGYGMDAYGYWRNLPGIWAIKTGNS
ncbi:hypoxanthine-guanine phosphoribosyltransferase [Noviherbaspirillum sp. UKPF54]|uniref:hypoxanthine-guanine phosphoribosyltransferase n=1 Tax=Noviherbaspirillum sp. UKPF54 TaxID=2601898 RepID=UPI0011B111B5|nr:hypoxanthine-guanine phosphoribosyltransferase [Noviherbaspirillum sp. UKPF54]QDZ30023.1 hypoxanthine-guanine phosphoribosyltransferase [Noviherbaspirillum sp. UKPF54]